MVSPVRLRMRRQSAYTAALAELAQLDPEAAEKVRVYVSALKREAALWRTRASQAARDDAGGGR